MEKVGIITAMKEEKEAVKNIMTNIEIEEKYNLRFLKGKIKNQECVLVECGVGKVNAARATQIMIDNFKLSYIINLGSAGAINPMLDIGDVVIGKHVVQHDFDITAFGHSKGYITGLGDKVICDRQLVDEFEQVIKSLPERNYKIKLGIVATGDIFLTESWMKNKILGKFNADIVDMECAAIAQVCELGKIPFIVVRSISDTPNGENTHAFYENLKLASKRCANILKEFLT